jgi:hypothetical protein
VDRVLRAEAAPVRAAGPGQKVNQFPGVLIAVIQVIGEQTQALRRERVFVQTEEEFSRRVPMHPSACVFVGDARYFGQNCRPASREGHGKLGKGLHPLPDTRRLKIRNPQKLFRRNGNVRAADHPEGTGSDSSGGFRDIPHLTQLGARGCGANKRGVFFEERTQVLLNALPLGTERQVGNLEFELWDLSPATPNSRRPSGKRFQKRHVCQSARQRTETEIAPEQIFSQKFRSTQGRVHQQDQGYFFPSQVLNLYPSPFSDDS